MEDKHKTDLVFGTPKEPNLGRSYKGAIFPETNLVEV